MPCALCGPWVPGPAGSEAESGRRRDRADGRERALSRRALPAEPALPGCAARAPVVRLPGRRRPGGAPRGAHQLQPDVPATHCQAGLAERLLPAPKPRSSSQLAAFLKEAPGLPRRVPGRRPAPARGLPERGSRGNAWAGGLSPPARRAARPQWWGQGARRRWARPCQRDSSCIWAERQKWRSGRSPIPSRTTRPPPPWRPPERPRSRAVIAPHPPPTSSASLFTTKGR